jgi:hypothetical protein|tara:strand:+ start:3291 stop:3551 length:261 start_codon:yes stop_codon:yes gene_type:complete
MVKLILLKADPKTYLIGKITELDEEPSLLIENVYEVRDEKDIVKYPLYTDQRDLFLTSDVIFTILDPSSTLMATYVTNTGDIKAVQ